MATPGADPADRTALWPPLERASWECRRLVGPPVRAALESARIPATFYDWVECGLDDLSVATLAERDPYSDRRRNGRQLAQQQTDGWLEPLPDGHYRAPARVQEPLVAAIRAGDQVLAALPTLPAADLDRLAELVGRAAEAARSADGPRRWAIDHRLRGVDPEGPTIGRLREDLFDLYARRDDVHLHAWRKHEPDGRRWNAFALIATGKARFAAEVAAAARFRGHPPEAYEPDIEALVERGWLREEAPDAGHYRATEQGAEVHRRVEADTDADFAAPLAALPDADVAELAALLERFTAATRELRPEA